MLKTRKLFHGLALAGALILGSASSFAQVCSGVMTTTNLGVRPEGLTELAGDIVVNCQAAPGTPTGGTFLPSDFSVLVQLTNGVSITNTATTGTGAPSLAVTADGAPVVSGSVAYPSGLPNAISFTVTGAGTGSSNAFTISGIRLNANQASSAGIASVYATLVITTVSETGTTVLPLSNNPSLVATILPKSLNFSIIGGVNAGESSGAASFPTCLEGVNVSGFFRFSENFSNVLRNQAQEGAGATNATYLRVVLSDVPAGVTILVPNSAFSTGNNVLTPVSGIGSSSASGINGFYIPRSGDAAYAGGYGTAGAEIVYSVETIIGGNNSTATLDTLSIPFIARYTAGPSVGIGTASAKGTLAPVGSTTAIPRFADVGDSSNAFSTSICSTTLLYPYVTTAAGFDTGIAIANTTADPSPLATANQSGTCTINPYGAYDSGATVPAAGESPVINAGRVWAFSLTDSPAFGSGARIGPGFSGYLIAQCNFQLAHGFAFVSDFGASRVAEGYLALVLNSNTGSRVSGATIERLSH